MSNTGRVYQIDQILAARHFVTREELLERLEVSWATLKRDLAYMRDRLNAPIVFDAERGGYCFAKPQGTHGPDYELPGLDGEAVLERIRSDPRTAGQRGVAAAVRQFAFV